MAMWDIVYPEIIYSVAVMAIALAIYIKTKHVYDLSKHRGLFHFRNIFLYFSLAYFLRFIHTVIIYSYGYRMMRHAIEPSLLTFILVGYLSTMAVLSIAMTVMIRRVRLDDHELNLIMHVSAITLTIIALITLSPEFLVLFQLLAFIAPIIYVYSQKPKKRKSGYLNKIIYISLFVFWVINLFDYGRGFIPLILKIILYSTSVIIFLSIYLRVEKRLKNAEKKKQARDNT